MKKTITCDVCVYVLDLLFSGYLVPKQHLRISEPAGLTDLLDLILPPSKTEGNRRLDEKVKVAFLVIGWPFQL